MSQKKQPNLKSTEDLLKDLSLEDEKKSPQIEEKIQSEDTVLTFLRFYNIEPGKQEIKDRYLYKLYKQFTKEPLLQQTFHKTLSQYLPTRGTSARVYLINQKVLNLSEKAIEYLEKQTKYQRHKGISSKVHYENFLKKYNISSGNKENWIWVSSKLLYNLYDKWMYERKKKQGLSLKDFLQLSKIYFIHTQDKNMLWFKINNSILQHVSREMDTKIKARNSLPNEKEKKQT